MSEVSLVDLNSGTRSGKTRILLVEDNPATLEVMTLELQMLGYEVLIAENGARAVQLAAETMPDLIVTDVAMPEMDGVEATRRIRGNPKTQAIPILAATARARAQDKESCLAAGCDAYMSKPFTHRQLGAQIEALLQQKKRSG